MASSYFSQDQDRLPANVVKHSTAEFAGTDAEQRP